LDDWELEDASGKCLAALREVEAGRSWRVVYPRMWPRPPVEPLLAAKHRAENAALWALPNARR
jgi:hypothetical protein